MKLYWITLFLITASLASWWIRERRRERDKRIAYAIMAEWSPKPRSRNPRTGRFRKVYASFTVRNRMYDN